MQWNYLGKNRYLIEREGAMRVDALIYLNEKLLPYLEEEAVKQLCDAASLPGAYGAVIGMPDIHTGFGLPIGGILATRVEDGIISAGAVGMDINCGVRLLKSNLKCCDLGRDELALLLKEIENRIPPGVGKKSGHSGLELREVLTQGARYLVKQGYGEPDDLTCCEEGGCLAGADPEKLSKKALGRAQQLATLGGGNHFLEIVCVAEVYDEKVATQFGLSRDSIAVLIHTGSRGLGHQVCNDYSDVMYKAAKKYNLEIPSKGLAAVPIQSPEGRDYYASMAAATNFAFANRQLISFDIREAFSKVLGGCCRDFGLGLVYDVCHNIAKFEQQKGEKILVHRKGAVRALPAEHEALTGRYRHTGNPVLIPGSMGRASYVVVATKEVKETFYSLNHGAGRILSRTAARKTVSLEELQKNLGSTLVNVRRLERITDEAPQAYKNVHEVIETLVVAGLSRKVAQLLPLAVIKGED